LIAHKNLLFSFFVILLFVGCEEGGIQQYSEEEINPLTNNWERAISNQKIPKGLTSLSAESCGTCHQQHYKEWKTSTHANAWTDLQFQSELKKESSPFMCINCHIPLQNQQEFIIKGLVDGDIYQPVKEKNPHYDNALQQEGINCAACHVRNDVIIGPTGTEKAPHNTVKDTMFLSEKLCISCHNANAVITPTLACTFQTGDEWKAGPFYGKKNCISCHMPKTHREVVAGFGERKSRAHYFAGSGIPKRKGLTPKMLNGLSFSPQPFKSNYKVNETFTFSILLKNEFAGHRVPTGDPERFFSIDFKLIDENENVIHQQKERIGEEWQWHPDAKKISDNNLNPGEERSFNFTNHLETKGSYTLVVRVTKHRMTEETAQYNKLGEGYPLFITVFEKEYKIEIK